MPRLCYGSAEQVNLLCSHLNRKVHFSPFSFQFNMRRRHHTFQFSPFSFQFEKETTETIETEKTTTKQSLEKFSVVSALSVVPAVLKINLPRSHTYLSLSATFRDLCPKIFVVQNYFVSLRGCMDYNPNWNI